MPDPLINPGEYTPYFSSKESVPNNDLTDFVNKLATRPQTFADINQPLYGYNSKEVGADRYKTSKYYDRLGFDPNWNNENKYYQQQPWSERLGNGLAQMGYGAVDTFSNYFAQYGRDFDSITGGLKNSWDSEYNQKTYDSNRANAEAFPIFEGDANKNSWLKYIPFVEGSAAAYGNVFSNLGFTAGTIGAALLEGAAIEYATAGVGTGVAAAKMGKAFKNIYEFSKAFSSEGKVLQAVNALREAKGLAQVGTEAIKGTVNAYRMYHTAAAEASFEAISGYNEHKLNLIQEFQKNNGYAPTGEDLQKIEQNATEVGNARFATNVGVLAVSNAIQWGSMMKLFKPSSIAAKGFEDIAEATVAKASVAEGLTSRTLEAIAGKEVLKSKGGKALYNVAEGFLSEGVFEEGLQNVIDLSTKDYYNAKYRNPNADKTKALTDAVGDGFKKTYTTFEGLENVIVGGLTGIITGGLKTITDTVNPLAKKAESAKKARINNAVAQFNKFSTAKDLVTPEEGGLVVQDNIKKAMQAALKKGDVYAFQNLKQQAIREFAITGIQSGKFDVRLQQLEDLKNLSDTEFKEAFGIDSNEENQKLSIQYIDSLKAKLKNIKANYEKISDRFQNPYNPAKFDRATQEDEFKQEVIKSNAYENAKNLLVSYLDTADNASTRSKSLKQDIDTIYGGGTTDFLMDAIRGKDRVTKIKELQDYSKDSKLDFFDKAMKLGFGWLERWASKGEESIEFTSSSRKKLSKALTILQSDLTPTKLRQLVELNNTVNYSDKEVTDLDKSKVFGTEDKEGLFDDLLKLQIDNRLNIDALNYLNNNTNFDSITKSYNSLLTEDFEQVKKAYEDKSNEQTTASGTTEEVSGSPTSSGTTVEAPTDLSIQGTSTGESNTESLKQKIVVNNPPANFSKGDYEFNTMTPRELSDNINKLGALDPSNAEEHARKLVEIYTPYLNPSELKGFKERLFPDDIEENVFKPANLPTLWQIKGSGLQDFVEVRDLGSSVELSTIDGSRIFTELKTNLYRIDRPISIKASQYFTTSSLSYLMYGAAFTEGQIGSTFNRDASNLNEKGELVLKLSRELSVPANNERLNLVPELSQQRLETFESEAQRELLLKGQPIVTLTRVYDIDITVHSKNNTNYATGEFVDLIGLTNLVILTPDNKTYPALKEQILTINGEQDSSKDIFIKNFRTKDGDVTRQITEDEYQQMKTLYQAQLKMRTSLGDMLDNNGGKDLILSKKEYEPIVNFYAGKSRKLINAIGDEVVNPLTLRNTNSSNPEGTIQGHRLFIEGPFNNFGLQVGNKSLQEQFEEITGQPISVIQEQIAYLKTPISQKGEGLTFNKWMILTFGKGPKGIGYEIVALKSSGPLRSENLYSLLDYVNTQITKQNTEPTRFDTVNTQIQQRFFVDNYNIKGKEYTVKLGISPSRGGALRLTIEARDNSDKKNIYISPTELQQILVDRENVQKSFRDVVEPKLKEADIPSTLLFIDKIGANIQYNTPRNITINDVSTPERLNDLLSKLSSVIRSEMYESGALQFKPAESRVISKVKETPKEFKMPPLVTGIEPTIEIGEEILPEETTIQSTTPDALDLLKENNNKKTNKKFKLELVSNQTKIDLEQETKWIKDVLPDWVQIEDLENIILDLNIQGKISGAFTDGIIYLNDKMSNRGTGYHESFHLVYTNILSNEDRKKYLKLAAREVSINTQDILDFSKQRNINYSDAKTRELMLEEYLADKFKEWKLNKGNNTSPEIKLGLFRLIDKLITWLNGLFDPKTKLYNKIDQGFFKNSPYISTSGLSKLELVPAEKDENGDVVTYLPANIGYETLSLMTIDAMNDTSTDTIDEKIRKIIVQYRKIYNIGALTERIQDFVDRGLRSQYNSIYGLNELWLAKALQHEETVETFSKELKKNLELINKKEDEDEVEDKEDSKEKFDKSSYEINPIDSINRELRRILSLNFIESTNELGEVIRKPLNGEQILTSMLRIAADTPTELMMSKLEDFGKTYLDLGATFVKFRDELFKLVKDNNGLWKPTSNIRFYNQLTTALTKTVLTHYVLQVKTNISNKGTYTQLKVNDASIQASKKEQTLKWQETYEELRQRPNYSKDVQSAINKAQNIFLDTQVTEDTLVDLTNDLISYFNSFGINIVPKLARISILAHKAETNSINDEQKAELKLYSSLLSQNNIFNLKDFSEINKVLIGNNSLFDEEAGASARLNRIAAGNASLDPTIPLAVFKNAEGKNVYQITNPTHFTRVMNNLRSEDFRNNLKEQEKFLEDNIFYQEQYEDYFDNINIGIFNGIGQDIVENGESIVGERITFSSIDPRSYLVADLGLYLNYRQVGNMKLSKGIVMQLEGTSTSYIADMPIQSYFEKGQVTDLAVNHMLEAVKQEYNKIKRNYIEPQKEYRGYNETKEGRGYKFFEFKNDLNNLVYGDTTVDLYLKDQAALNIPFENAIEPIIDRLKDSMRTKIDFHVRAGKREMLTLGIFDGQGESEFLPSTKKLAKNTGDFLGNYYTNRYLNTLFLNQFLLGDASKAYKNEADITKRQKGIVGAITVFNKPGAHKVLFIEDQNKYILKSNPYIQVEKESDDTAKVVVTDGMAYTSPRHRYEIEKYAGKLDTKSELLYKKILRGESLSFTEAKYLESRNVAVSSLKTLTFGGIENIYIKKSEHTLIRSAYSILTGDREDLDTLYDKADEAYERGEDSRDLYRQIHSYWTPMPGFEYYHDMLNLMELESIDEIAHNSASKAVTPKITSIYGDISNSIMYIPNEFKGIQSETPSGKKEITEPTQLLDLITAEQDDETPITIAWDNNIQTVGQAKLKYKELLANIREEGFKKAQSYFKDNEDGTLDISEFFKSAVGGLEASGADQTTLELFSGDFNINLPNTREQAEKLFLAHYSKNAFSLKVPGYSMALVTDYGHNVIVDENDNIIRKDQIIKNPKRYSDTTRYKSRNLGVRYDTKGRPYFEVIIPKQFNFKIGDLVTLDNINSLLGTRIPTQDKHSMQYLKVVDYLPSEYGSIIIAPHIIHYLSGSDLDIDKMYIQRKSFYLNDNNQPVIYGEGNSYEDYIAYQTTKNLDVINRAKQIEDTPYNAIYNITEDSTEDERNIGLGYLADDLSISIKELKKEIKKDSYIRALKELGYPTTEDEFSTWFIENPNYNSNTLNNKVLDLKIELLTNNSIQKEIAITPATDQIFKDFAKLKNLTFDQLLTQFSLYSTNGRLLANRLIKKGDIDIGIFAVANKVNSLLSSNKVNVKNEFGFKMRDENNNYYDFNSFTLNPNYEKVFGRKNDTLSAFLGMSADSAKNPYPGLFNIGPETASTIGAMISMTAPYQLILSISNSDIIKKYTDKVAAKNYALHNLSELEVTEKSYQVGSNMFRELIKPFLDLQGELIDWVKHYFNSAIGFNMVTSEFIQEDTFKHKKQDFVVPKALKDAQILNIFLKQSRVSQDMTKVNALMGLTKSLSSEFISEDIRLKNINDLLDPLAGTFEFNKVLDNDILYRTLLENFKEVQKTKQKIFLDEARIPSQAINLVHGALTSDNRTKEELQRLKRAMVGYLTQGQYRNYLASYYNEIKEDYNKATGEDKQEIGNTLDTLADVGSIFKLSSILKANPTNLANDFKRVFAEFPDNEFLKFLRINNKDGLSLLETAYRANFSEEKTNKLIDSYRELYENPSTNIFAIKLLLHSLVKDNLYNRGKSYIKYVHSRAFKQISYLMDQLVKTVNETDTYAFIRYYLSHIENIAKVPILSKKYENGFILASEYEKVKSLLPESNFEKSRYIVDGNIISYKLFNTPEFTINANSAKSKEEFAFLSSLGIRPIGEDNYIFPLAIRNANGRLYMANISNKFNNDRVAGYSVTYVPINTIGYRNISPYSFTQSENERLFEHSKLSSLKRDIKAAPNFKDLGITIQDLDNIDSYDELIELKRKLC